MKNDMLRCPVWKYDYCTRKCKYVKHCWHRKTIFDQRKKQHKTKIKKWMNPQRELEVK